MKYALIGHGRMGRAVDEQAARRGHTRTAVVDPRHREGDRGLDDLGGARLAFEFTVPEAAERNVRGLMARGVSVVCGTTGWVASDDFRAFVGRADAGCVIAPNFSAGVHVFFRIVEHAARAIATLGLHDPFVQEAHHRGKVDAPSGTARRLASILLEADDRLECVLEGHPAGGLPPGRLQVVSTRAGFEPGTHRVGFDGEQDLITLEHRARGREGFALGAVLAAEWLVGKQGMREFDEVMAAILRGELSARGGST